MPIKNKNAELEIQSSREVNHSPTLDLSKISNKEILFRMEKLSQIERKNLYYVLWHILEVDKRQLFSDLGFTSLYNYLTQHLGYSEKCAYERMKAARLLKTTPEVCAKIESGNLNLSHLVKIERGVREEQKQGRLKSSDEAKQTTLELLNQVQNKTQSETEQIIAEKLNQPLQKTPRSRVQKDRSLRVEFTLSLEQQQIIASAKSIMSHKIPDGNWADVLTALADFFVHKNRAPAKPKKAQKKTGPPSPESENSTPHNNPLPLRNRKRIPAAVQKSIFIKAQHRCEFQNERSGERCQSTHQLQIDHIVPWAISKNDSPENLRILCAAHNRSEAKRWGLSSKPGF